MVKAALKFLARVELHILLGLMGLLFLPLAFFESFGLTSTGFAPRLRPMMHTPLLIVSVGLLALSVSLLVWRSKLQFPRSTLSKESAAQFNVRSISYEQVKITYNQLSRTQQNVVSVVCGMPGSSMPLDDFFKLYAHQYGAKSVESPSEMYFRLEVLSFKGLCDMNKIAAGSTLVVKKAGACKTLRDAKLLRSPQA
jgi:hypothetical protein